MKTLETIKVMVSGLKKQIQVQYSPISENAVFDICDLNGRVILTGDIIQSNTSINVTDLISRCYILLILDGDSVVSKKFEIA